MALDVTRTPWHAHASGHAEGRPDGTGPAFTRALESYFWALTTGLMSPAQVPVFFTRA